jgi:hypothetical protein
MSGPWPTPLSGADQEEAATTQSKSSKVREKIAALKKRMEQLKEIEVLVQAIPDKQISPTDPDARSMATSGKRTGVVGYNVQTGVDAQHHLIAAHEVTNVGNDGAAGANGDGSQGSRDPRGPRLFEWLTWRFASVEDGMTLHS